MRLFLSLALLLSLLATAPAMANKAPPLPATIQTQAAQPLKVLGGATYRKFGFRVYHVALWVPGVRWDTAQPYALQLTYRRDLSKDTLVDGIMDGIREQEQADDATLQRWEAAMNAALTDVNEGDSITGLAVPGQSALLFLNGKQIMKIEDKGLSDAFFAVWLGKTADEDMREKLLSQKE